MNHTERPVLLYDGLCGFCDGTVQVVLRADRRGLIQFAALQSEFAEAVLERHPSLRDVDSLILVRSGEQGDEQVDVRSDAVLALAVRMGGLWRVMGVLRIVPRFLRDTAYDLFARHRYRVFGRRSACRVPAPDERDRFIG